MNPDFKQNKYIVLRDVFPQSWCDIVVNYAKFQSFYAFSPEIGNAQVPNTHSKYSDFLMEAILLHFHPIIEKNIGAALFPTYSYYRVYKKGDDLKPHTDRHACEVSATIAFGWPNTPPWPFKLANHKEFSHEEASVVLPGEPYIDVLLNPGDALIYAGPLVKHWRDPFENTSYVQAFFHYVYAEGPHAALKFDGRPAIGRPK
jgi:hypothetical protein